MEKVLIIKTGAAGDVVRTTSLLNVLNADIYWVADPKNMPLLPEQEGLTVLALGNAMDFIKRIAFDVVISLEEDISCARLAAETTTKDLTGIYLKDGRIDYTDDSAHWFDMSRVSRFGLKTANQLKWSNRYSYQHHIFRMTGKEFNGEPYLIYRDSSIHMQPRLTGVESRTGAQWPDKQWWGYDDLCLRLTKSDFEVKRFRQYEEVRDYLREIDTCSHIVSGDSLAMHVALAYNKSCTAIFNCTSPWEIHDYGLLNKVVSPLLEKYFYVSTYDPESVNSVSLDDVMNTLPVIVE
jgi:heptosyltransferase-2